MYSIVSRLTGSMLLLWSSINEYIEPTTIKKNLKMVKKVKFITTLVVVAIAGICITTSCSKEQNTNNATELENTSKSALNIANEANPYDYCGRIHNEILDYIIMNNSHPTQYDIYYLTKEYLQNEYNMCGDSQFEDMNDGYNDMTDFIVNAILEGSSFNEICPNDVISGILDSLVVYADAMIKANSLLTPNEYAARLVVLENSVMESRLVANIPSNSMSEYDVALGALAIARYSYAYWYEVGNSPDNLWNNIIISSKEQDGDNDDSNGFWGKLWKGICHVVVGITQTVVQVATTPIVDVSGFAYGGITAHDPSWFGLAFDIEDGIECGGRWSGEIWKWHWNS